MLKKAPSRFFFHLLCGLLFQSAAFCSDERPASPPANSAHAEAVANSRLARVDVDVAIEPKQPDVREGLTADVVVTNRNTVAIDLINPQNTSSMELYTADGQYVQAPQPADAIFQRMGAAETPSVLHLEPGQEHRFTVVVTEYLEPQPVVAATQTTTPASETGVISTNTAVGSGSTAATAAPRLAPLPEGTYKVHVSVSLTHVRVIKGQRAAVRTVRSEAVNVVYGSDSSAGSDQR